MCVCSCFFPIQHSFFTLSHTVYVPGVGALDCIAGTKGGGGYLNVIFGLGDGNFLVISPMEDSNFRMPERGAGFIRL